LFFLSQELPNGIIAMEVMRGTPLRIVPWTFSVPCLLGIERPSIRQFARVDDAFRAARAAQRAGAPSAMRPGALSSDATRGAEKRLLR
jgi:hypothetical protein